MRGIQLGLIGTGSSTRSLSVLLSAVEMGLRTQTAQEQGSVATIISTHVRVPTYSDRSYYLRAAFILFGAADCAASIRGWRLFEGGV